MLKGKILVVDDSPIVRKLAEVSLQGAGYEVYTASDGEEGLKTAEAVKPDLILVDFIMPKITGTQFYKFAKENEILKDIPIILITGKGESVGQTFIEKYGALDYFMKPFKSEDLIQKVESTLNRISEVKYGIPEGEIEVEELSSMEKTKEVLSEEISFDLEEIQIESTEKDLEITEALEKESKETQEIEDKEIPEEILFEEKKEVKFDELLSISEEPVEESKEVIKPSYDLSKIDKLIEEKLKAFSEKVMFMVNTFMEGILKKYGLIKDSSFILSGSLNFFKLNDIFNLIHSNKLTGILSVFVNGTAYEFMFIEGQIVYGISNLQKQKTDFGLLNKLSSEEIKQITIEALSSLIKSHQGNFLFEVKQFSDPNLFNKIRFSPSEVFSFII